MCVCVGEGWGEGEGGGGRKLNQTLCAPDPEPVNAHVTSLNV